MATIKTRFGYSVDCYGECNEYATIMATFDDELYDGCVEGSFKNWREAVKCISGFAKNNGTELVELESDS